MSTRAIPKQICSTCLSSNRKLFQLCRVPDGVNLLYSLLMCDVDAYREGFYKDPSSWLVCWECRANMRNVKQFQQRACTALKQLEIVHRSLKGTEPQSLSNLSTCEISPLTILYNDFNDCGVINIKKEKEDLCKNTDHKITKNKVIRECEDYEIDDNKEGLFQNKDHKITKNEVLRNCEDFEIDDNRECIENEVLFKNETEDVSGKEEITINGIKTNKKKKHKIKSSKPDKPVKYPCTECDLTFENKGTKWKHVQKCHREGHKCTTCEKVFSFKHNLERHQKTHQGPHPRVECPTCHKLVRTSLLATHARTHAQRQRVACVQCDKEFICRATYENHLKYALAHAGAGADVFRYKCESCESRYRSRGELRDHVAYRHNGQPRHKCPVCDKLLATQRCVTRHVRRTHHGVKENTRDKMCHHCGNAFRDKKSLREHVWTHTGARPHGCAQCGRAFRQRAALHAHTRRLHKPSAT